MKNGAEIIAMFFVAFAMASTSTGMIFTVDDDGPADFNNIQTAIDHAYDGVTIVVADGIYRGEGNRNISLRRKAITLHSENGWLNCIIDCEGEDRGFYFYNNENENSIVDGFTIINGNAYYGGGIYCYGSSPTITNCNIRGNKAVWGAGIFCRYYSSPKISNCIINGNNGTGINCSLSSNPEINNCLIIGNMGCGIFCFKDSIPIINNCTIIKNIGAYGSGIGILSQHYSNPIVSNCILWENMGTNGNEIVLYDLTYPSTITVTHSDVQGGSAAVYISPGCTLNWGQNNIDADPMFMDIDGLDDVLCTEDDNLRLFGCSPCIDAGNNSAIPPSQLTDIEGNPRIINGTVDMGAYEGANQGFLLSTKSLTISEGATAAFTVALAMEPNGIVEAEVTVESGDPDITVHSGALLTFDPSNYFLGQTVVLAAAEDADNLNGTAFVRLSAPGFVTNGFKATEVDNDKPSSNVLFVDASGPGVNNGSSWAEAYTGLQDALTIAAKFSQVEEIHVAQGTYTPAERSYDLTATFQLINGISIKGGYAGFGEPDPDSRDIYVYETVLSGDLARNDRDVNSPHDLLDDPCRTENSYHVVTASGTNETTVLDGFTVTAGARGGMYNYLSSPTVINCTFIGNSAEYYGGGMYNCEGSPIITNCTFTGNSVNEDGGAIYNYKSTPILLNCTFNNNCAENRGGGIYNSDSSPKLTNCTFSGNSAGFDGGGMFNGNHSSLMLKNCTFSGNKAGISGGGIYYQNATIPPPPPPPPLDPFILTIANGIPVENEDTNIYYSSASDNIIIYNCILWENKAQDGPQIYYDYNRDIYINYSDVQGGWPGEGNINSNPFFVEPGYWNANGVWIEGDYHLLPASPCIDAGDPNYAAEPNKTDLDGRPRVMGVRIDMGAYESVPPIPAQVRIVPRTINLQGKGNWITCYIWLPEDCNVANIDSKSIFLNSKIKAESVHINEEKQVVFARFSREEVQSILNIGEVELSIICCLIDGTAFKALDVIRVIDESGEKPDKHLQASNPNPTDGAKGISITADLSWMAGSKATSHDVYFGTSSTPPFVCNQIDTIFDPGTMDYDTTYYWRINEVSQWGKTTGQLWNFTTKAKPPPPPPLP